MGRVSESDRKMFRQLVKDCMDYGLNTEESIIYISERTGGRNISRSKFFQMKKEIAENEEEIVQERLTEHNRIGFAVKHFEIMDSIEGARRILYRSLIEESRKPMKKRNLFSLSRIAKDILEYSKVIMQLNDDTYDVERAREMRRAARNRADGDEPIVE
jgi:hypothetical protein